VLAPRPRHGEPRQLRLSVAGQFCVRRSAFSAENTSTIDVLQLRSLSLSGYSHLRWALLAIGLRSPWDRWAPISPVGSLSSPNTTSSPNRCVRPVRVRSRLSIAVVADAIRPHQLTSPHRVLPTAIFTRCRWRSVRRSLVQHRRCTPTGAKAHPPNGGAPLVVALTIASATRVWASA